MSAFRGLKAIRRRPDGATAPARPASCEAQARVGRRSVAAAYGGSAWAWQRRVWSRGEALLPCPRGAFACGVAHAGRAAGGRAAL